MAIRVAAEHDAAVIAARARPETVEVALAQILDIQQERALTYSLFDEYVTQPQDRIGAEDGARGLRDDVRQSLFARDFMRFRAVHVGLLSSPWVCLAAHADPGRMPMHTLARTRTFAHTFTPARTLTHVHDHTHALVRSGTPRTQTYTDIHPHQSASRRPHLHAHTPIHKHKHMQATSV